MDPELPDVAADPSCASEPVIEPTLGTGPKKSISEMSPEERHAWRKSGKVPDATAASSTATADQPAGTPAISDPASEPAPNDPDYKPKTAARIKALLAENQRLRDTAAMPPASRAPAASQPAPVVTSLVKPDPEKFTYGTADPDYLEALTDYKVAVNEERRAKDEHEAVRKRQTDDAIADINRSWMERRTAAEAHYPDFKDVALAPFKPGYEIAVGSVIDAWILESEHGADVLYALQKTPTEIRRINALKPLPAARELAKLEETALAARAVKTLSTAPDPGPSIGVRAGDPASPVQRAIKKGDAGSYIREKNREALAARASRRGH